MCFKRKLFPKDFLNSPVEFVLVRTIGRRGHIEIFFPQVCALVFVICPKMTHREFLVYGAILDQAS